MNVISEVLGEQFKGLGEAEYLEALSQLYSVQVCSVPSNGSCFFDSIYALLPTVGKAVKSSKLLRLHCVQFFRECHQGLHGVLGERIMDDVNAVIHSKIISSCANTRCNNKRPKSVETYLDAVSLASVWVEGIHDCFCVHSLVVHIVHVPSIRIPLAKSGFIFV